jgi:hypothetical protein
MEVSKVFTHTFRSYLIETSRILQVANDLPIVAPEKPTPSRPSFPVVSLDLRVIRAHVRQAYQVIDGESGLGLQQSVQPISSGFQ